jgi:hypothetical protein
MKNRIHHLLFLLCCCLPMACSISTVDQNDHSSLRAHQDQSKIKTDRPDVSIEQLESDPTYLADLDSERRALQMSQLWLEHGSSLERTSYTGAFTALTRAAHTALDSLLGERCRTPFHAPCLELSQSYRQALSELTKLLVINSWTPPDMQRTRYDISAESIEALKKLRNWRISFDSPSSDEQTIRPGLGLAAVGCRDIKGIDTACAPLTFVAYFSAPTSADHATMTIKALDGYQQEIISINSTNLPIAAAIDQTVATLGRMATNSEQSGLFCLSLPTAETTTTLTIVENTEAVTVIQSLLAPLLRDEGLRLTSSFCIGTTGHESAQSGSDTHKIRALLESLRSVHTTDKQLGLSTSDPLPLYIIAVGDRSTRIGLALANRASRVRQTRSRRAANELRFETKEITVIDSNKTASLDRSVTDILTRSFEAPCDAECLASIKQALYDTTPEFHQTLELPNNAGTDENTEGLELSPVM